VVNAVAGTSVITNSVAVAVAVVETGGTTIKTRRVHRLLKGHNSERMATP
jgi:hypothetical protein